MTETLEKISPEELVRVFGNVSALDMLRSLTPGEYELGITMQMILRMAIDRLRPHLVSRFEWINMRRNQGIDCGDEFQLQGVYLLSLELPSVPHDRFVYISLSAKLFMVRECLYHNNRSLVPKFNHHYFLVEQDCSLTQFPFAALYNALVEKYETLRQKPANDQTSPAGPTKTEEQARILDMLLDAWKVGYPTETERGE